MWPVRNKTIIGLKLGPTTKNAKRNNVRNKTIIGLKLYWRIRRIRRILVRNKTIIGLKCLSDVISTTVEVGG